MACKINIQAFFFHVFQTRHLYTPGKMHLLFLSKGDTEEGNRGSWGFQNWFIGGSIVDSVMLLLFYTDIRTRSFLPSTDSKTSLVLPSTSVAITAFSYTEAVICRSNLQQSPAIWGNNFHKKLV